jgi:hypothetical protein
MEAIIIVGISFVDLKMTFVGNETYRTDKLLKHVDPNATILSATYGMTSIPDFGNLSRDNVFPLDIATGRKNKKQNWNNVTQ